MPSPPPSALDARIVHFLAVAARSLAGEAAFGQIKVIEAEAGTLRFEIEMTTRKGAGCVIGKGGEAIVAIRALAQRMGRAERPPVVVEVVVTNVEGARP
jgi:predicted RNA-binding protein YlqC (UPF0109 family)